jgi:hypothetical protein
VPHTAALALVVLAATQDPLAARVRQTAYTRMDTALTLARDQAVVGFVAAKNAAEESMAAVRQRDARWSAGGEQALRKEVTGSACADRLRKLTADDPFILDVMLMDGQGALVCATRETSDYWQGDEAKWRRPVAEGAEAFVDEPAFDESVNAYAIQMSVPVISEGRRIGAVCVTLKVPRPTAAN